MSKKKVTRLSEVVDDRLYIAGITRREFAYRIGIAPNTLGLVLRGQMALSLKMSKAIADGLDIDDKQLRKIALETIKDQQRAG